MNTIRLLTLSALVVTVGACSLTRGPVEMEMPAPQPVLPAEPPPPVYMEPVATQRFEIDADVDVVGHVQVTVIGEHDTLPDVARRFNVGYDEIVRANPGVDPWLPGVGREVVVPTQFVLPNAERKGVVVNVAAMRIYYFAPVKAGEKQVVYTHPIGIGKIGWSTPEGKTRIVSKEKDPTWRPTANIRAEHKKNFGETLPAVVPAGPDNPLGRHKLTLGWPTYLIHGTNKPYGVGLRSSHGCIRMYPEDVEQFFSMIPNGTQVQVVNQPYVFGWHEGQLYVQTHGVMEDDKRDWKKSGAKLVAKSLGKRIEQNLAASEQKLDWERVLQVAALPRALPQPLMLEDHDEAAIIAAAPKVENRVPEGSNWDGADDPALQAQRDAQELVAEQRQTPRS